MRSTTWSWTGTKDSPEVIVNFVGCRVTESGDVVDNSGVSVAKAERCGPEYAMDPLPEQDFTDGQERV